MGRAAAAGAQVGSEAEAEGAGVDMGTSAVAEKIGFNKIYLNHTQV
jgi:hypothetical protein